MLEEVLCGLAGFGTSLTSGLLLPSLSNAQRAAIAPFISMATLFARVRAFVADDDPRTLYADALRRGLQDAVVRPYEEILQASYHELQGLDDLSPLTTLRVRLHDYELLLPALVSLLDDMQTRSSRGVQIVDRVFSCSQSGVPVVQAAMGRILHEYLDKVVIHQTVSWVGYGVLCDPFDEFWVQHNRDCVQSWNSAFVLRRSMVSEDYLSAEVCNAVLFIGKAMRVERVDELTQRYVSLLNDVNASGIGIEPTSFHALIEGMRQEAAQALWQYVVEKENLLDHLHDLKEYFFLAKGALFEEFIVDSGELMRSPPVSARRGELDINQTALQTAASKFDLEENPSFQRFRLVLKPSCFDENLRKSTTSVVCAGPAHPDSEGDGFRVPSDSAVWHRSRWTIDDGFCAAFAFMACSPSATLSFVLQNDRLEALGDKYTVPAVFVEIDNTGLSIRLSSATCSSIIHRASFEHHLLDGREHCASVTWAPHSGKPNAIFQVSFDGETVVDLDADAVLRAMRVVGRRAYIGVACSSETVILRSFSFRETTDEPLSWSRLTLSYNVPPGIDLILRDQEIDRYADLFAFLLRVKKVHWQLRRAWSTTSRLEVSSMTHSIALLRAQMQFLLDNLQIYLHVDVIEAQYSLLVDAINKARAFEAIKLAHDRYLAVLAQQCFLHARVIMRAFEHVFAVCIRFCALIESGSKLDDEVARQVMGIRNDFQRESCFLFSVLSSKTGQYSAPHLSQLVLRVNFNGYFSGQVARIGLTK
ncbi:Spindle pole body component [Plasmodiophora brassicae]